MNIYIIDDEIAIPSVLQRIIESEPTNTVVGKANSPKKAFSDIVLMDVDIVLVDLLMPEISGIELIKKLRNVKKNLRFVMISKVTDASLREEAYEAGIEFFINKPINVIEVKSVIQKVSENLDMMNKLNNIQQLVKTDQNHTIDNVTTNRQREKIISILSFLGISSEIGVEDILSICKFMISLNIPFQKVDINKLFNVNNQQKKTMLQRIRRSAKVGMENIANMYLDEVQDEITNEYANCLYGYKNIRNEIRYLQDLQGNEGSVSLKQFFDGLVQESNIF